METRVNDVEAGKLVARAAHAPFTPGVDACFTTHRDDGTLMGGSILASYTGASMWLHEAGIRDGWMTRDLLWVTFHYPFVQLGCTSLIGATPSDNERALALALKIGFEVETVIKDCMPGGAHLIITRMWRDRCKWLNLTPAKLRDNQTLTAPTGGFHGW